MHDKHKPIVVITGAKGNVGTALEQALQSDYCVVGCDRPGKDCQVPIDLSSDDSVKEAFETIARRYSTDIAAVVHLAAYFDFTGEESPLYESVNVEGTRRVLKELQKFNVERFIYSSTMLVHEPSDRPDRTDENSPINPKWAYPRSKAKTEEVIRLEHGKVPYTILRLAGLYDEKSGVPTLSQQIARIYEKDMKSHLYAGDSEAGQSFIHKKDMIEVFRRTVDRRASLPKDNILLAGETDVMSYNELQECIGKLIHGENNWKTWTVPKTLAKAGAWVEETAEPIVPDDYDEGQKPFIKPFMIDMASDHYALDISRTRELLDWQPQYSIRQTLPAIIANLKEDPEGWYSRNKINPPEWIESSEEKDQNAETIRKNYQRCYNTMHYKNLWAHFLNIGLGFWLIAAPFTLGYQSQALIWSDVISGLLVVICGLFTLSPAKWMRPARFDIGLIGLWLMFAPLVFHAPTAAAYLNGTIIGALLFGLALGTRPFPLMSPTAAMTGPEIPPGWDFSPSSWLQRIPVIILAFIGFYISRYLTAYQLGHIDAVWEPFFPGSIINDNKNGTEEIITSSVSQAWPVPDAGLGAFTYMLEILTGLIGSSSRWRTMPWLVLLFGVMIIPLGFVSITFIIIQPILLGTWCTLCLIAAMAMLLQIPYSFDEVMATIGFLRRRARAVRSWLQVLFTGDTDEVDYPDSDRSEFQQHVRLMLIEVLAGV